MQLGLISHSHYQAQEHRLNVYHSPQFISNVLQIGQVKVDNVQRWNKVVVDASHVILSVKG